MARGRLIFPFLADIRRLDTSATESAEPPPDTGYDTRFRAPRIDYPVGQDGPRTTTQRYLPQVLVPCQVEPFAEDRQRQMPSGNVPDASILLVFHFESLEGLGLVDTTTGEPLIRVNDKLVALLHHRTRAMVHNFAKRKPPGLFAVESRGQSYGLTSLERNLLLVPFNDRPQGLTGQP